MSYQGESGDIVNDVQPQWEITQKFEKRGYGHNLGDAIVQSSVGIIAVTLKRTERRQPSVTVSARGSDLDDAMRKMLDSLSITLTEISNNTA